MINCKKESSCCLSTDLPCMMPLLLVFYIEEVWAQIISVDTKWHILQSKHNPSESEIHFLFYFVSIFAPPPRVLKADARKKVTSEPSSKTLPIIFMFVKRAGLSKIPPNAFEELFLQMLNLAGAWHLLLSKLPLISNIAVQGALLPVLPAACQKDIKEIKWACKAWKD